jgi:hypothetical protein
MAVSRSAARVGSLSARDVVLQDFWVHMAGIIAIALGVADLAYFHELAHDSDLLFVIGGFGAMGLKIVNGSAAALRDAALNTAFAAARQAQQSAAVAQQLATPAVPPDPVPPATPPVTGG